MAWQQKRVLVTGAGGFLGSHLVERLAAQGARMRALVRYNSRNDWGLLELLPEAVKREIDVVLGDLTDPFGTARALAGCDVVFHLAALIAIPYSYLAPAQYVAVNCGGTLNLLEAARNQGVERFIHTSTSETYGTAQYVPIDEAHPLKGQSPYAASKIGADKLAESDQLSFGLPVVTLRPFNTYGPRQSARAVIPENVGARKIKELVEKKAGDRVEVQVFTAGQIGDQRTMVENMRNGVQETTWVTVGFFGSYEPILNVIESGYLFRDSQHSYKVFDGPMGNEVRALVEKHGVKLLGYYEAGMRHITNSVRPIKTPEDLKGLKIRTPQAKYHLNTLKYMGANPVAMSFGELYTAMQQKVVDGQENPFSNISGR